MNHIELHILQELAIACVNRDEFGSPKTAIIGGIKHGRVSSQCWKRAVRQYMRDISPEYFAGMRTRLLVEPLQALVEKHGIPKDASADAVKDLCSVLSGLNEKPKGRKGKDENGEESVTTSRVKTMFFCSPMELDHMAEVYAKTKDPKKALKALAKSLPRDAADIACNGRMVAQDPSVKIEGAAMYSHAFTTHAVDNEIDFFSAVDECQVDDAEHSGAGMTGNLEFNSGVFYRFAAMNLDMLADEDHLKNLTQEERQHVVRTWLQATIMSMPMARHNSMYTATLPAHILVVVRKKGHPLTLANAFEIPVRTSAGNGLMEASYQKLEAEFAHQKKTYGTLVETVAELRVPDISVPALLDEVSKYVR